MPSRLNAAFIRFCKTTLLSDETLAFTIGWLGIFILDGWIATILPVIAFAAQPAFVRRSRKSAASASTAATRASHFAYLGPP
jgi:hypothetical protein